MGEPGSLVLPEDAIPLESWCIFIVEKSPNAQIPIALFFFVVVGVCFVLFCYCCCFSELKG